MAEILACRELTSGSATFYCSFGTGFGAGEFAEAYTGGDGATLAGAAAGAGC